MPRSKPTRPCFAGSLAAMRGDLRDVVEVLASHPVDGRVEVRPHVLTAVEGVPVPRRAALVVPADLPQPPARRVRERLGQSQNRRPLRQRLREIDRPDRGGGQRLDEGGDRGHVHLPGERTRANSNRFSNRCRSMWKVDGPIRDDQGEMIGGDRGAGGLRKGLQVSDLARVGDPRRAGGGAQVRPGRRRARPPAARVARARSRAPSTRRGPSRVEVEEVRAVAEPAQLDSTPTRSTGSSRRPGCTRPGSLTRIEKVCEAVRLTGP